MRRRPLNQGDEFPSRASKCVRAEPLWCATRTLPSPSWPYRRIMAGGRGTCFGTFALDAEQDSGLLFGKGAHPTSSRQGWLLTSIVCGDFPGRSDWHGPDVYSAAGGLKKMDKQTV